MASYKVDVRKQFGTFRARFYEASQTAEEQEFSSLEDVLGYVRKNVSRLDFEEDSVIFRGIAYESQGNLEKQIKAAPY